MASDGPFCGVAAGWRLRARIRGHGETVPFGGVATGWRLWVSICGHGETFLSAGWPPAGAYGSASVVTARRSFLLNDGPAGLGRAWLWSGVDGRGEPAVPAGRGVPQRSEPLPD